MGTTAGGNRTACRWRRRPLRCTTPPPNARARLHAASLFLRVTGMPLERRSTTFEVVPSSGADERIVYEDIQKLPTRSYFSGVETGVPNGAKTVTLRWASARAAGKTLRSLCPTRRAHFIGPGSWGDRLNSLRVAKTGMRGTEQLEITVPTPVRGTRIANFTTTTAS